MCRCPAVAVAGCNPLGGVRVLLPSRVVYGSLIRWRSAACSAAVGWRAATCWRAASAPPGCIARGPGCLSGRPTRECSVCACNRPSQCLSMPSLHTTQARRRRTALQLFRGQPRVPGLGAAPAGPARRPVGRLLRRLARLPGGARVRGVGCQQPWSQPAQARPPAPTPRRSVRVRRCRGAAGGGWGQVRSAGGAGCCGSRPAGQAGQAASRHPPPESSSHLPRLLPCLPLRPAPQLPARRAQQRQPFAVQQARERGWGVSRRASATAPRVGRTTWGAGPCAGSWPGGGRCAAVRAASGQASG